MNVYLMDMLCPGCDEQDGMARFVHRAEGQWQGIRAGEQVLPVDAGERDGVPCRDIEGQQRGGDERSDKGLKDTGA